MTRGRSSRNQGYLLAAFTPRAVVTAAGLEAGLDAVTSTGY